MLCGKVQCIGVLISSCKWLKGPLSLTLTRSQAALGEGFLICGMSDSMFTQQSRTADKGRFFTLSVGRKELFPTLKNQGTKC